MSELSVKTIQEGAKNCSMAITGTLGKDLPPTDVVKLAEMIHAPRAIRIDSIVFAIQEKLGCLLWWKKDGESELILPLESRGTFDFEKMQGLHSPKAGEWEGVIQVSTFGFDSPPALKTKHFLLLLDMTKQ